ncbi:MAG: REP-associated tyrosine transposase [Arenimonas sp.]
MEPIESTSPGTRALREGRHSCPRQIYSITSVCINREKLFSDYANARLAVKALNSKQLWPDAKCLAWVVMPDHMHVLIELGDKEPLPLAVQRIKSLIAIAINQERNLRRPIWQRGYFDHAIRKDEDVWFAARYILNNPVRAGLAVNIGDYPYWSLTEEWFDGKHSPLW